MGRMINKTALVVLADGFEDIEASACIDILNRAGAKVTISGMGFRPVHGAYGCTIISHTTIDKIEGIYDCLILPSVAGDAESPVSNPAIIELVRRHNDANKLIAAFGDFAENLSAIIPGILSDIKTSGAVFTDKPVTVDGNIIIGMGPGAALPFALEIVEYLFDKQAADDLAGKLGIAKNKFRKIGEPAGVSQ